MRVVGAEERKRPRLGPCRADSEGAEGPPGGTLHPGQMWRPWAKEDVLSEATLQV